MKFSDAEKLIIVMLADIQKTAKVRGEVDPDFVKTTVINGYEWSLSWEYPGLFDSDTPSPPEVKEVADYLDMWDLIEIGFSQLNPVEKKHVKDGIAAAGGTVRFPGFDGNNETTHLGIARHFIEQMGRWSNFKSRELNSHFPTLRRYENMYEVFEPMRDALGSDSLSANQIITLVTIR